MFKRANKVTALLVAAASIMSIVPAMATTRLGTKDGHIKGDAYAFEDGKYIYEGYRTNDDDNGIYYNDGSTDKEKANEDLKDYKLQSKYGTKYAYAENSNDQYLVDLSTGKIVDDETPEDRADAVKGKLRTALKKTDRYALTSSWDTITLGDQYNNSNTSKDAYNLNQFGNQFGEVWYRYTAEGDNGNTSNTVIGNKDTNAKFTVQLPATVPLTYTVGTTVITSTATTTKGDFAQEVVKALVGNLEISTVFDVTTFKYDSTLNQITGTAKAAGHVDEATKLTQFTVVDGLGATTTDAAVEVTTDAAVEVTTGAAVGVALDAVLKAEGSKLLVDVDAARKLVDGLTDTSVKDLYNTRLNKILVIGYDKALTAAQVASVTLLVSNPTNATVADFTDAGLTGLVVADGSEVAGTSIGITKAKTVLVNAIKAGKLGDGLSDAYKRQQLLIDLIQNEIDKTMSNSKSVLYLTDGVLAGNGSLGTPGTYTGFVSESGKYIDASATANIYAYSQKERKTIKIKEFNKENQDYNMTVGLQDLYTLGQDKDYIYVLAKVAVSETGYAVKEQYFIQKLSKAQSDAKKDDAYVPKSVDSYQVDNETIYDCGDATVAYNFLVKGTEDGFTMMNTTIKDGNLYITGAKDDNTVDHDKVKVFKIVLKKDKIDSKDGQKDVDVYIAKKDADSDIEIRDNTMKSAIAYDINGNTWVIGKGTITKFNGTEKKEMYTTDRSFDHLDVYDDNNLIAWDQESEVYTTVQEGTKKTQDESTAVAPVIVTGWVQAADGTWTFNDTTGAKVVAKWINVGGVWYYMKADGVMATGWYQDGATWYFLATSGAMKTGWLNDNGTWYYLNGSGAMLANTTVDGYVLGASGAWVK